MTSEDVYDVARQIWCYLCEAPHLPCESPDLRMECLRCFRLIEHNDEARFEGEIFHKSCARALYRLRAKQREETEMASKYPPFERVTLARVKVGDDLLVRERLSDQPWGAAEPVDPGVWKVVSLTAETVRAPNARRASRTYHLELERPGRGHRSVRASASERFNRVVS